MDSFLILFSSESLFMDATKCISFGRFVLFHRGDLVKLTILEIKTSPTVQYLLDASLKSVTGYKLQPNHEEVQFFLFNASFR